MNEELLPNKSQEKPSKKERMATPQRELEKEMIRGVWKHFLYGLPVLFGFMAFAISLSLGCFIAGFSGVIIAIKKQAPSGRGTLRGKWAVILGLLNTTFWWVGAAYFFWIELSINWWGF
jgi:hypothetical protein